MGAQLSYPVADLAGKVAVITGGNAGIGYETAKALALMGARTIIACRSEEKATAVSTAIDNIIYGTAPHSITTHCTLIVPPPCSISYNYGKPSNIQ